MAESDGIEHNYHDTTYHGIPFQPTSPKDIKVEPNDLFPVTVFCDVEAELAEEKSIASNNDGKLTRSLERALTQLLPPGSPTVSVKTTHHDDHKKKIVLRTSEEIQQGSDIELPQFDPNFFSLDQIHCRYTNCPETKARNPNHSSKTNKEDLYLCPNHRRDMVDVVTKKCSEKGITVNFKDSKIEDFNGYTSLIGLTEKAFQHFKEKCSQVPFSEVMVNGFLAEIFLNVRNFFIITNTVLNPDQNNVTCTLPPITTILTELLRQINDSSVCSNRTFVENLNQLLREIMDNVLCFFNVVYDWVTLPFKGNLGAQIGAGLGCAAGAVAAGVAFGPAAPLITLGAGIGLVSGGLFGGGIFNLKGNHDQQHNTYQYTGNPDGGLILQMSRPFVSH